MALALPFTPLSVVLFMGAQNVIPLDVLSPLDGLFLSPPGVPLGFICPHQTFFSHSMMVLFSTIFLARLIVNSRLP